MTKKDPTHKTTSPSSGIRYRLDLFEFPWGFYAEVARLSSLGFIDYSYVRKDDPTPARDVATEQRDVPTALAQALQAHGARKAQIPQIKRA